MILTGIIESTMLLKEPCHIEIFTKTPVGFSSLKGPNKDLLLEFDALCKEKEHTYQHKVIPISEMNVYIGKGGSFSKIK